MNNKNLKRQEALRARLNLRDIFVQHAISQVYDNVCQSLSLVRLHMSNRGEQFDIEKINHLGELLAQSIRDLRGVCKNLTPDYDVEAVKGFPEVVKRLVPLLHKNAPPVIIKGEAGASDFGQKMILIDILSEILISTGIEGRQLIELELFFDSGRWLITVKYRGPVIEPGEAPAAEQESIDRRIRLADGKISISENDNGEHCLQLIASV